MIQRILVTGASGFLGHYVLRALAQSRLEIVALTHKKTLPESLASSCAEIHTGDIDNQPFLNDLMKNVDAVCHLAAYIPPSFTDPAHAEMCFKVNALATGTLAHTALQYKVERFVYISAGNAYPRLPHPATEDDPIFPSDAAPYYLLSKFAGEVFLMNVCSGKQMTPLVLRLGTPYGPGEPDGKVVSHFINSAARGDTLEVFNEGRATYNFIHAADAAQFVVQALTSGDAGIYNIGPDEVVTLRDLAERIAHCYADRGPTVKLLPPTPGAASGFALISNNKARSAWPIELMTLDQGIAQYRAKLEAGDHAA